MRTLLLKDLIVQKNNLVIGALYSLLFFVAFGLMERGGYSSFAYSISGIAVGGMILVGSFAADKNDTPRFLFSMPITRADAVNAKFLLLLVATIFGTLCATVLGALFMLPMIGWADKLIGGVELLRIAAGMTVITLLIPLYFRFGQQTIKYVMIGGIALLVVGQIVGMLALTLSNGRDVRVFDQIMTFLFEGDPVTKNLLILAAGVAIAAVSYVASRGVFARKGL